MSRISFDGRVAAVTGAGRGIGRAYAVLLAQLGAKVVVNDLGGSSTGAGADPAPANKVVDRIRAAGGTAIANLSDVSTVEGGQSVVDAAIGEFGRIDVLINNAGNMVWAGLPDIDLANLEAHLDVHVKGSFNTVRAAWPYMVEQDYGRIVLTTSIGMFGLSDNLGYATSKASMIGMARSMTAAAGKQNIRINCIGPNAMTRLANKPAASAPTDGTPTGDAPVDAAPRNDAPISEGFRPVLDLSPAAVAPMVAYLAHEECGVSGEVYLAGGGRFARLFVGVTEGYLNPDPAKVDVDDVAANWAAIQDETGYYVPSDPVDWSTHFMSHLYE
ncbi:MULTISPECIES: SDR family NAD(P)-dependent oxidoreductase [unclassified Pseudofrankia]|uniref:SDR family NAD(P)-dependent oxidoreductase n=1 Tax=unclassified Pseudofrankia TaxID=2994372 RepID=UPI0008D90C92|nr:MULTISPECIES: SDR family NAD(P)-dependent oxidoreductase [unclassified Pseudofrankia]MDT3444037.1 SDR family NAD(P)-dependent oxidoreductase [Pseudofrankia sp. BMG5.37]OHV65266.1 short-chain dehydrogenase [Pseudofrankia sp. BMG5.36]